MEVTPWFSNKVQPVRPGVYSVMTFAGKVEWFAKWTGIAWCITSNDAASASDCQQHSIDMYREGSKWRGLASDPNARNMEADRHEDDTDNWW